MIWDALTARETEKSAELAADFRENEKEREREGKGSVAFFM